MKKGGVLVSTVGGVKAELAAQAGIEDARATQDASQQGRAKGKILLKVE